MRDTPISDIRSPSAPGLWLGNISPDVSTIRTLSLSRRGQSVADLSHRITLIQRGDVSTIEEG
jgi:hypothetical protein